MIKAKLIKIIQERMIGANITADGVNKLHELDIEQYLNMAWNTLLGQTFKDNTSNYDRYCKTYKNILIQHDTSTHEWYSLLPIRTAQLIDTQEGVRRIFPMKSYETRFIPISRDEFNRWSHCETGQVSPDVGYCVLLDRVLYEKQPVAETEVRMDIVPAFDEYLDEDDIPIPAGADVQLFQIILGMLQNLSSVDKRNDNIL